MNNKLIIFAIIFCIVVFAGASKSKAKNKDYTTKSCISQYNGFPAQYGGEYGGEVIFTNGNFPGIGDDDWEYFEPKFYGVCPKSKKK